MDTTVDPARLHRGRLLNGMARAVAIKGFAAVTIADIVREAAVSRRTFYEHFGSREECFIALYEAASHNALEVLRGAVDVGRPWNVQVHDGLSAYFACMASEPDLMRTLFVEVLHLGDAGLAARRRVNTEIASFLREAAARRKGGAELSAELAMAVVGGINELILAAIERGRADSLVSLVEPAGELVRAVTGRR